MDAFKLSLSLATSLIEEVWQLIVCNSCSTSPIADYVLTTLLTQNIFL